MFGSTGLGMITFEYITGYGDTLRELAIEYGSLGGAL